MVLDDMWNENVELWHKLKSLLVKGAEGSKIIVTTRSEKVGKMIGTYPPIILKGLDCARSWELFCRMAFEGGKESNDKDLLAVGREIVQKCAGVPLAIRIVGRLVYDKTLEGIDLSYLWNCELWNIDQLEERIFAVLKLSYDHLPSPMKNCVAFCSLFPKDFSLRKQTLIQMWVAKGFIQSSDEMRCEEDVGHEYFMNLLSRSFFQDVERKSWRYSDMQNA
ncbi:putative disease resistance protein RGA4 [Prosopis cineraria]|uniref:putative disease resistance protein RGA4 n=1 Tax=Prosopis cineraria TaxID=364024 RepID=UPI00240F856E|nr:putative disease resistance protein RGA4 [Prosopis cineraria]